MELDREDEGTEPVIGFGKNPPAYILREIPVTWYCLDLPVSELGIGTRATRIEDIWGRKVRPVESIVIKHCGRSEGLPLIVGQVDECQDRMELESGNVRVDFGGERGHRFVPIIMLEVA